MSLSVIILGKNVASEVVPTLKTVRFADEVIFVDTGSTDNTLKVVKPYVDKLIKTSSIQNFSKWRNLGASKASSDWLLYIDSDERIPKPLADEIITTIKSPAHEAFRIHRFEILIGKHLKHWPDSYVLRLIKKSALKKWTGKLHEQPIIEGKIGTLKGSIVHLTHKNIEEKLLNTLNWSRLEAEMLFKANHPPMKGWRFWRILFTEFLTRFVKQGLWKDGIEGNIEVIYQMFSRFLTYVQLWQMQRKETLKETYSKIDKRILDEWKGDK